MTISFNQREVTFIAIRAQGAGGQNINKVSNAVQLRFDIDASSLPEGIKREILSRHDRRISLDHTIIIKAQLHRSLKRNKEDGLSRLQELIAAASIVPRLRQPTLPHQKSKERRVEGKIKHGKTKLLRGQVREMY